MSKPEKRSWKLDSDARRGKAVVVVNAVPIGPDHPVMKLTLEVWRDKRSAAQQALMWIWHYQWQKHFGDTAQEEHIRFKKEWLLPILLRDNVVDGLHALYKAARQRYATEGDELGLLALYELISTTTLNTKQFAEILTSYQQEAVMEGLVFTVLCSEYEEAMGK